MTCEGGGRSNGSMGCIDMITALPHEIRERILGYLPICEAVRTSILSQKWRYTWIRAPQLNFYFDEDMERDLCLNAALNCALVGKILLSHIGPIHTCILPITLHGCEEYMNTWIQFLSRNCIKDLCLLGDDYDYFPLPRSVFQCLELSCLTIRRTDFYRPIDFRGFPNLVELVLMKVVIIYDALEKVVSSCPLEVLCIDSCSFFGPSKTDISAPHLRVLKVICDLYAVEWTYLKHTPNLRKAVFLIDEKVIDGMKSNCFSILSSMPNIEMLTFNTLLHKTSSSDGMLAKLQELLVNLKTVELLEMDAFSLDSLSFMFCILRSSPNLQTLDIRTGLGEVSSCRDSLVAVTLYLDSVGKEAVKTNVKTFSVTATYIEDEEYLGAVISLIDIIVSFSPALEKLLIKTSPHIQGLAKQRLSRALRHFRRSSSKPKIIHSDADD